MANSTYCSAFTLLLGNAMFQCNVIKEFRVTLTKSHMKSPRRLSKLLIESPKLPPSKIIQRYNELSWPVWGKMKMDWVRMDVTFHCVRFMNKHFSMAFGQAIFCLITCIMSALTQLSVYYEHEVLHPYQLRSWFYPLVHQDGFWCW